MNRESCRQTVGCPAKVWYVAGEPYVMRAGGELAAHVCNIPPPKGPPVRLYLGVWRNSKTGRIRYSQPCINESSARRPPNSTRYWDGNGRKNPLHLVEVRYADIEWHPLEESG